MPAYALKLEYDGTGFVGWQRQTNGLSLQQVLEEAAAHLAGGLPVTSIVAGRTDAGVHAAGQVARIELPGKFSALRLRDALNFHMKPHSLVVLQAALAPAGWSPRFSATSRSYRYTILNRRPRPALALGHVWHNHHRLDTEAMHAAAQSLLGTHDFTSFRAASCQAKSPIRTLDRLDVVRRGELIEITATARSFLHHQVRNLVGTLVLVGEGNWPIARVATALAARARAAAGPTAPSDGLCLLAVAYDPDPFAASGS